MIIAEKITKEKENHQRPTCPICKSKLSAIGISDESKIENVTVKCKKCGTALLLKTQQQGLVQQPYIRSANVRVISASIPLLWDWALFVLRKIYRKFKKE